jgi:DNA polymerase-3 subunit alpha
MASEHKPASFVHLRVKSAYSLLEGAMRPKELAELARTQGMPAVAVTDVNNLFGAYEISETLAKAGVQPIIGCLLSVDLGESCAPVSGVAREKPPALPLLVQNAAGYQNLTRLLGAAYLGAEPGDWPHVKAGLLSRHAEGLLALTGDRVARPASRDVRRPALRRAAAPRPCGRTRHGRAAALACL